MNKSENKNRIKNKERENKEKNLEVEMKKINPEKDVLNPDAWGRLIGPHNVSELKINGNKIIGLLDTGCQITNISQKYCEDLGLEIHELENLVDIVQADGSCLDYVGYVDINLECELFPNMSLDIPVLVVPYTSYHDQVPLTVGTKTLSMMIDGNFLQNDIDLPTTWKYAYHSIMMSRELEKTPGKPLSKMKASKKLVIPAFQAIDVQGVVKSKGYGLKVHVVTEGNPKAKLPEGVVVHPAYTYLSPGVNKSYARVVNFTSRDKVIKKNTVFGLAFMGNKIPDIIAPSLSTEKLKPETVPESKMKGKDGLNKASVVNKKIEVNKNGIKTENVNKLNKENVNKNKMQEGEWVLEKLDLSGMDDWSLELKIKAKSLLCEYSDIFSRHDLDLGKTHLVKHDIKLMDKTPFKQGYRRIPPHLYEDVRSHLKEMIELGAIRKSQSPWSSAIVLVQKKDGGLRFCIDLRELNNRTVKDNYSLPKIDHHLEQLIGAEWFTTLDLKSGYWQVELEEHCKPYTAFTCGPLGFYECNLMPFGASNAPATFQRLMENCLGDLNLKWCVVYLDDIIVFARTADEHLDRLRAVFEKLRQANLKLKCSKCNFFKKEIIYLGHHVSSKGIACDPKKIEVVKKWPKPETVNDVRSFLGFVGYYRRFIKGFSKIARPLNDLLIGNESTKKQLGNKKIKWTGLEEESFEQLREACCEAPVLAYADFSKPFVLHTDSSLEGLGAVLYQKDDLDQLRVIAYASRSLTKSEKNYPAHKLEFLAMKWAITDKFKEYLYGAAFEVFTDNNPLTYINTSAKLDATTQRWVASLASYVFDIYYRAGKHNVDADCLSRIKWPKESNDILVNKRMTIGIKSEMVKAVLSGKEMKGGYMDLMSMSIKAIPSEFIRLENETSDMNKEQWVIEQNKDVHIKFLKEKIKLNKLRHSKLNDLKEECPGIDYYLKYKTQYKLVDELLYRRVFTNNSRNSSLLQLVLPKHFVHRALAGCHDQVGHVGRDKTIDLLKERFFWPTLNKDTVEYLNKCRKCIARKGVPQKAALCPIEASRPMEIVHIDFLTLEPSKGNIENVLVITDHFTRYAQAYPSKTQTAQVTAKLLWENFFAHYGFPEKILSDQGRNFESSLIKDLCKLARVNKIRTTPYHPQGNGQCERFNRTLLNMLGTMSEEDKLDWKTHLSTLTHAYNCTKNSSTNYSPYFLMFGRHPRLPVDVDFGLYRSGGSLSFSKSKYVDKLHRKLQYAYKQAKNFADKMSAGNKSRYDKKTKEYQLEKGDVVLVKIVAHKSKHKIQNKWEDCEYVVVDQPDLSIPVYVVQPVTGGSSRTLHRNLLYPLGYKEGVDIEEDSDEEDIIIPVGLFGDTKKEADLIESVVDSSKVDTVVEQNTSDESVVQDSSTNSSISGCVPVVDVNNSNLELIEDSENSDDSQPTEITDLNASSHNISELLEQSQSMNSVDTDGDLTKLLEDTGSSSDPSVVQNESQEVSIEEVAPRRSQRSTKGAPPTRYGQFYSHRLAGNISKPSLVEAMKLISYICMLVNLQKKSK